MSMLTHLKFHNFKSWPVADMQCGRITGIFGTNSSGKTSLLQFLLLMKQTKDATDRATTLEWTGNLVKLGTFADAVHRHEEDREISWTLGFDLEKPLELKAASTERPIDAAKSNKFEISASVSGNQKSGPSATSLSYRLGAATFSLNRNNGASSSFNLEAKNTQNDFRFIRTQGRAWPLPGPIKSYAFPDQARTFFQNSVFLADLEKCYEGLLDNLYYLGPLRVYPERDYQWARTRPTDVGPKGEKTIDAILAARDENRNLSKRAHKMPFEGIVAYWLRELGLIDDFRVQEIAPNSNRWQAKVTTRTGASEVLLTDVGFGISQVLPVITLLQYVPEGSIVLLEQPEIHLHPLAQAALADVLIQAATHRNVQIILESHSEHLLMRLQRRIAEGDKINADDVRLYFCDAPKGESRLTRLEVDMLGSIRNWPANFMGDAFGETAAAEEARLKRTMSGKL